MKFAICFVSMCALWLQFSVEAFAQDDRPANRVADAIYDVGNTFVIIPGVESTAKHVQNAVEAITDSKIDIDEAIKRSFPESMSLDKPTVIYNFDVGGRGSFQMRFDNVDLISRLASDPAFFICTN